MREKPAQQWKPDIQNIKIIKNVITHFVKRRRHSFLWINSSSLITGTLNLIQLQSENRSAVSDSLQPHGLYSSWNSLGQNTGVDGLSLLQGIFPTQWSNTGLPQCRRILYQLSHQGSPRILGWVVHPFSSESSWPRNRTGVSCIAGDYLPTELSGNPPNAVYLTAKNFIVCCFHFFHLSGNINK